MITVQNYEASTSKVDFSKLPDQLKQGNDFMVKSGRFYDRNTAIKNVIDKYIELLNAELASQDESKQTKPKEKEFFREDGKTSKPKTKTTPREEVKAEEVKEKQPKAKKVKQRKPKYKVGDTFSFRVDEVIVNLKVEGINPDSKGEPLYSLVNDAKEVERYLESLLVEKVNGKVFFLNQVPPVTVYHLDTEVKFIKRYASLNGKVKSRDELLAFLHAVQKAINEKVITKKSQYAKEITTIQDGLVKIINTCTGGSILIEIDEGSMLSYNAIATGQKVMYSIPIMKQFIMISGKSQVKAKAGALLKRVQEGVKKKLFVADLYKGEIAVIEAGLKDYISGKMDRVLIPDMALRGLYGFVGMDAPKVNLASGRVVSSSEFLGATFNMLGFTGKWKQLFGNPAEPFKVMIYGNPGEGKSSLALTFANYLAKDHNKRVLMVSQEEGFGYTLKEKIQRLGVSHPNLFITDVMPSSLANYDVIVLDSVNTIGLEPDDLRKLYTKYPAKSWICIHQNTKEGKYRGSQEYEHDVDVSILCENMIATPKKSRFGGKESVKIA